MASYPIEIRRCGHIRSHGTQCGSPALKEKEFCYYHQQNRPRMISYFIEGDGEYPAGSDFILPVLEDAHAIQTALRQVLQLLLEHRIDRKDGGLALYALQIASGNLRRMEEEQPKPTHVVVEPEKAAETPLGMTPWSERGKGHDPEDGHYEGCDDGDYEDEECEEEPRSTPERLCSCLEPEEARVMRDQFVNVGLITKLEYKRYLHEYADDPLLAAFGRLCAGETKEAPLLALG